MPSADPSPEPPRKKRKPQKAGGQQGHEFDQQKGDLLGTVFAGCKTLISSGSELRVGKRKLRTTAQAFEFLTQCGASVGRKNKKLKEDGKEVQAPKKKGPKPSNVDERFEGFYDWVVEKIESAKKGGFVTLDSLKRDLQADRALTVSKRVLRRTLRKLGFRYVRRVGKWFSRRQEERVQRRLWDFLEWVVENSSKAPDGKPVWDIPVAFQDETFIHDGQFREFSICAPEAKGSRKLDRGYDEQKKGKGTRVNVLHCIFSHIDQPTKDGKPECLEAWKSTWKGKNHKYKGSTVQGTHVAQFFREHVFHRMAGGAVCLDNASSHKVYTEEMGEMGEAELIELIISKTANAKKGSYRGDHVKKEFDKMVKENPLGELGLEEGPLRSFVRKHLLYDTELYAEATRYNLSRLIYLPQYYPECNPIERYWALLKRRYYDTDPTLPHKTRLAQALAAIPDDYVDKCFRKSLEWCWAKHAEMKKLRVRAAGREGMVSVGDEELASDSEDESGEE